MTEVKKENPQKVQSKKWLAEALQNLMKEKAFKQISITEIAERAGLSRRTFYRHFNVVEDILHYIAQELCDQYASMILKEKDISFRNVVFVYFTFCELNKDLLLILEKNDHLFLLLQKYNEFLPEIRSKIEKSRDRSPAFEYALYFSTGGFWNMSLKWIKDGAKVSPKEMAALAEEIFMHFE